MVKQTTFDHGQAERRVVRSGSSATWRSSASSATSTVRVITGFVNRFPAFAMALGDVAARHKLEVRVIPRMDSAGPSVLVLFGSRTYRSK